MIFNPDIAVVLSILIKDECERHAASRQELMHKLSELTAHCKEVERQRDEEAENYSLLKVPPAYLTVVVWVYTGQLHVSPM